jgi:hypothetical protein
MTRTAKNPTNHPAARLGLATVCRSFLQIRFLICVALGIASGVCAISAIESKSRSVRCPASTDMGAASENKKISQQKRSAVQFSGEKARDYLTQTSDGQSLLQALTAARFGLKWQEHPPGGQTGGAGYLGLSHDQNLKVWFDDHGMTVRPTLSEEKPGQAWSTVVRLTAYGYGKQLVDIPPIVSRMVKANRIEYERVSSNRQPPIRDPQLVEWYENRAEGVEQGFTINERPARTASYLGNAFARCSHGALSPFRAPADTPTEGGGYSANVYEIGSMKFEANEPLRMLLAVTGDLHAQIRDEGTIELVGKEGKGALSYDKLVAGDADGKKLAARMEASADGREIALVVEDAGAHYPIMIDPVVASLEQKLRATGPQADARFGFAVAIDGDRAVVGAWREDTTDINYNPLPDAGVVYTFTRSGGAWSFAAGDSGNNAGDGCGESVAISGTRVVYGCPGANGNTGRAFLDDNASTFIELVPFSGANPGDPGRRAGDRYGASIAISGNNIVVGSPAWDFNSSLQDTGSAYFFRINPNDTVSSTGFSYGDNPTSGAQAQAGTAVAVDGNTAIIGIPGVGAGRGVIYTIDSAGDAINGVTLRPGDGAAGDQFGQSVAISGNTAVIGAPENGERGAGAGAAYVFVRDTSGNWSQQQKLTASDGEAGDFFGASHIAIEGNTIVAGSYAWDVSTSLPNDDRGAAYVFMRSGTVWTQQTRILANDSNEGDNFGVGLGISRDTVIVGARSATAVGTASAGAAYVYRLDCVPRYGSTANINEVLGNPTVCPRSSVVFFTTTSTAGSGSPPISYQWRKNGVNIPGATGEDYTINQASTSDIGSYDLISSNACGSDISSPAKLGVYAFSLTPTSQNFGVSGSTGIVNVTATSASCSWTAVSNASFITVNSGSSGTGNGTVGFTVASNPDSAQRIGTVTIADQIFTVSQDGTQCSYLIAPTSQKLGASASTNTVNVTASAGCAWTATSNDPFLSINSGASGSGNGTVTYTIAANFNTTQRTGSLTIAGQTFTATQAGAPGATSLGNISTRLQVDTGDNVLIGGFIITGTQPKKVMIRAIGLSLPFPDDLADPILELHDSSGALLDSNDNWMDSPNKQAIIDSTIAPTNDLESAIVATLPANGSGYTAIMRGVNNGTGIGVVEAYDLDRTMDSKLANISTRGLVQTGDDVLIAGTIVVGQTPQKVLVEALGPSLSVPGALADPTLELRDGNGALLDSNDNWVDSPNKQAIIDSTIPPTNDLESAIVATLPAGGAPYTAVVRGVNNAVGVGVIEVFALN